jgi:DoxX-like protein
MPRWPPWGRSVPNPPDLTHRETDREPLAAPAMPTRPVASASVWVGHSLSTIVVLFLAMGAAMKIAALPIVAETAPTIGWTADPGFWRAIGVLLLVMTALYAWPRTALLGAVVLTGYLGRAVATHVRVGHPLFGHILFGVCRRVALRGGLWLRDGRVRTRPPLVRKAAYQSV